MSKIIYKSGMTDQQADLAALLAGGAASGAETAADNTKPTFWQSLFGGVSAYQTAATADKDKKPDENNDMVIVYIVLAIMAFIVILAIIGNKK